jgi:hypothetical protein
LVATSTGPSSSLEAYEVCLTTQGFDAQVGPVSAVGKRVGPVIEKSLVQNLDWTVTIF